MRRANALAAMMGDMDAAVRYEELAKVNPSLRKEYLQRAYECRQSADRWGNKLTVSPNRGSR